MKTGTGPYREKIEVEEDMQVWFEMTEAEVLEACRAWLDNGDKLPVHAADVNLSLRAYSLGAQNHRIVVVGSYESE